MIAKTFIWKRTTNGRPYKNETKFMLSNPNLSLFNFKTNKKGGLMHMRNYVSKEVVCPFYRQEKGLQLHCEGFDPSCSLQVTFAHRGGMVSHKRRHCNTFDYPDCPIYPAINAQYE